MVLINGVNCPLINLSAVDEPDQRCELPFNKLIRMQKNLVLNFHLRFKSVYQSATYDKPFKGFLKV